MKTQRGGNPSQEAMRELRKSIAGREIAQSRRRMISNGEREKNVVTKARIAAIVFRPTYSQLEYPRGYQTHGNTKMEIRHRAENNHIAL